MAAYLALSAAAGWGHKHGKNADTISDLAKTGLSEEKASDEYRKDLCVQEGSGGESRPAFPCTDKTHEMANGTKIRNLGVFHIQSFFHTHHSAVLGAVESSTALTTERALFFDYCAQYAKTRGKPVLDLEESRRRERAATWGRDVWQINIVACALAMPAFYFALVFPITPSTPGKPSFSLWRALRGLPNLRKARDAWRNERLRVRASRPASAPDKKTFREVLAEIGDCLRIMGRDAWGRRRRWYVTSMAAAMLVALVALHAAQVRDVLDPSGSQTVKPDAPALSRLVDRFSVDFDSASEPHTVANSTVTYDSRTMYDHAKSLAASLPRGSTLLVLTGNRHAKDFEDWFSGDPDFIGPTAQPTGSRP